jgi:3-hydroxyacyl-CoA dehydrogenase
MNNVIVVIGAGSIGQAIARRVSAGKHVLLADLRQNNIDAAARILSGSVNLHRSDRKTRASGESGKSVWRCLYQE